MNTRRVPVLVASIALTLAACGNSDASSTADPATTDPATTTEPPATVGAEATPADTAPDTVDADAEADDAEEQVEADDAEAETTEPAPAATDGEAPPETNASSAPAAPAEIGGRALATEVIPAAQFDGNPFPDLVVADVGRSGEANLANLLPSDRPILLWAWAPH